jgi:hypothetical protein
MTLNRRPLWKARWLESRTGPLEPLRGRKVVFVADLENLTYGARDLDFRLDLPALTDILRDATRACVMHAVFSAAQPESASPRREELENLGWRVHLNSFGTNSDNLIIWKAASIFTRSQPESVFLLGSGDGDLVNTVAHCVHCHLDKPRSVFTLSLPGSTAARLNCHHNPWIGANLEIGRDCLSPFFHEGGHRHAHLHTR